jgi:hypothetical protein
MSTQYGALPTSDPTSNAPVNLGDGARSFLANLEKSGFVLDVVNQFSPENFKAMKQYVADGNLSIKVCGKAASGLLAVIGVLGFLGDLVSFNIFGLGFSLICAAVGCVCFLYDYNKGILPPVVTDFTDRELRILSSHFGRSTIYVAMGLILLSEGNLMSWLFGLVIGGAGGYTAYSTYKAEQALLKMKEHAVSETQLKVLFDRADRDKSGKLDSKEVASVLQELGTPLNFGELEAAMQILDKEKKGQVSYEALKNWYIGSGKV